MTRPGALAALLLRRRAAAGLSQAALAERSGCTRQYVAQLERGQRRRPSRALALRLAAGLGLVGDERREFLALAGWPDTEPPPDAAVALEPAARRLFDALPYPAALHDAQWRLRHRNAAAERVFAAAGLALPLGHSLLELVFAERYRRHFPDWERWARYLLAQFRRDSLPQRRSAEHRALLAALHACPDFTRLWRSVEPAPDVAPLMAVTFFSPAHGTARLTVSRMQFVNAPHLWGIAFLPENPVAARLMEGG